MTLVAAAVGGINRPAELTDGLLARDRWSRERLLAHQRAELGALLAHAVSASPYYRESLGARVLEGDVRLEDLPTLSKQTLMDHFDSVVTDPRLRLREVEAHVAGGDPGGLFAGEYHLFCTSGTTGRRGVFPQSAAEFGRWVAAGWRTRLRAGIGPETRAIGIAAPTPLHITQKLFAAFGGFGGDRPRLTVTTPVPELVAALNRDQPEAVFSVPTLVGMLAEEQLAGRLVIAPRAIVLAGEVIAEDVIGRIADAWGIRPYQVYASTEALMLSAESRDRVGFHVSEDLVVLEVVDEHNRPVPPGPPGYKVLVTSLVNRSLPLIRYELADSVTLAAGPDPSGRPFALIERVDGRSDDSLRLRGAGGGEVVVLPHRLRAPFAQLLDVLQYQIVHEPQRIAIRVVLREDASRDTPERVLDGVRAAIEAAGAERQRIEVEPVAEIEREPGGAKLKLVKSSFGD